LTRTARRQTIAKSIREAVLSKPFKAACLQFTAVAAAGPNLEKSLRMTREAAARGAELVCLPEYFSGIATEGARFVPTAFTEARHPILPAFREAARELGLWILLGSLAVTRPDGRVANRSYLIDPSGRIAAKYDKIHLFDVDLGVGKSYRESEDISPGSVATVAETPWGGLGLSVCYDLRFPQLYRALAKAGATMLAVPAAFTRLTGRAHWHVLNRARAIENGAYVIAPCQNGTLEGGGECFGHSLIVDPWGEVLAEGGESEGVIVAEIDLAKSAEARRRIPSLQHDRLFAAPEPPAQSKDAAE
jgi:predicted amidohydrolase